MSEAVVLVGPRGTIADHVVWARSFRDRRRGVLGRPPLEPNEALIIWPCRRVHTRGVAYSLDAVFCDRRWRVLHVQTLAPQSLSKHVWRAKCCVELLGGRAATCGVRPGVQLRAEGRT